MQNDDGKYDDTYAELSRLKEILQTQLKLERRKSIEHSAMLQKIDELKEVTTTKELCLDDDEVSPQESFVGKKSQYLLRKSGIDKVTFLERIRLFSERKNAIYRRRKIDQARKEILEMKDAPNINKKSKTLHRTLNDIMLWGKLRERKVNKLREQQRIQEESVFSGVPTISTISVSIAKERQKEIGNIKVEDRLLLHGKFYKNRQEDAQRGSIKQYSFNPELDSHSLNLKRRGCVFSRLYRGGINKRKRNDELSLVKNIHSSKPLATSNTTKERPSIPVADRLTAKGIEYEEHKRQLRDKQDFNLQKMKTLNKMNLRSRKIVLNSDLSRFQSLNKAYDLHDDINVREKKVVKNETNPNTYKKQLKWKLERDKCCSRQREIKEKNLIKQCTFKNMITQPQTIKLKSQRENRSFFDKCQTLEKFKYQKLKEKQDENLQKLLTECTFKPEINHIPTSQYHAAESNNLSCMNVHEKNHCGNSENSHYLNKAEYMEYFDKRVYSEAIQFVDVKTESTKTASLNDDVYSNKEYPVLPDDWEMYTTESGEIYYYSTVTNKSQWDFPIDELPTI